MVALYHERWELELGFDEVKTELLERRKRCAARSRGSRRISELGLSTITSAWRWSRSPSRAGVPPTRISFMPRYSSSRTAGSFAPPWPGPHRFFFYPRKLRGSARPFSIHPAPRRSRTTHPRAVKIKMSAYRRSARSLRPHVEEGLIDIAALTALALRRTLRKQLERWSSASPQACMKA